MNRESSFIDLVGQQSPVAEVEIVRQRASSLQLPQKSDLQMCLLIQLQDQLLEEKDNLFYMQQHVKEIDDQLQSNLKKIKKLLISGQKLMGGSTVCNE